MAKKKKAVRMRAVVERINRKLAGKGQILMATRKMKAAQRVMDRMTKGKFRHMPVLDKDRLAGLVSIGDVLKLNLETIREHIHQLEASFAEFDLMRL